MPAGPPPVPTPPKSSSRPAMSQAIGPAKRARNSRGPPLSALAFCMTTSTFLSARVLKSASSTVAFGTRFTSCREPSFEVYCAVRRSLCTRTISTFPLCTCSKKSEYVTWSSALAGCRVTAKVKSIDATALAAHRSWPPAVFCSALSLLSIACANTCIAKLWRCCPLWSSAAAKSLTDCTVSMLTPPGLAIMSTAIFISLGRLSVW
mmetsp:Transcript_38640/g.92780  ORF Transcript_38640/g.92780 Transcript_38640/m.92780 type:complete len:206 (-) Transcript_38640:435-1052(-)